MTPKARWRRGRNVAGVVLLVATAIFNVSRFYGAGDVAARMLALPMFSAVTAFFVYQYELFVLRRCSHVQVTCNECRPPERPVRGQVVCTSARSIAKMKPRGQ